MTDAERAILDLAAARGEVVLGGNKDSYSYLKRQVNGLWLRIDGDPMTQDEEVYQIDEAAVLRAIFWRAREMLGRYGPNDGSVGWDDVLVWLQQSHV